MTQVIWAPQAIEDVQAIRAYVARDSAHYADLVVERILAAVVRLESHPLSGRVVPEVADEHSARSSRVTTEIVYRRKRDVVEIVTVFHGARLFRLD